MVKKKKDTVAELIKLPTKNEEQKNKEENIPKLKTNEEIA